MFEPPTPTQLFFSVSIPPVTAEMEMEMGGSVIAHLHIANGGRRQTTENIENVGATDDPRGVIVTEKLTVYTILSTLPPKQPK